MFDRFIEKLLREGKSDLTIRQYRSSLNRFEEWLKNQTPHTPPDTPLELVGQATQIDIGNFKRFAVRNFKPNTVRQTLTHLKAYMDNLVDLGEIVDNPVKYVDAVHQAKQVPKWLNHNEQNALIRSVRKYGDLRELTKITFMLHTGVRVQELCDVKLTDLELSERKGKVKVLGKHNRYREIPLNVDVRRIVTQYIEAGLFGSQYVFGTQRSEQMTTRAVQHIIEKYRKLTGINHLTAHALRHTFCHELVRRKIALDVVARLAGHIKNDGTPNIQQTLVYTQPGEEDLQRAVEELSWV